MENARKTIWVGILLSSRKRNILPCSTLLKRRPKPRIAPQRIKPRIVRQINQPIRMMLVRALQRFQRLCLVSNFRPRRRNIIVRHHRPARTGKRSLQRLSRFCFLPAPCQLVGHQNQRDRIVPPSLAPSSSSSESSSPNYSLPPNPPNP